MFYCFGSFLYIYPCRMTMILYSNQSLTEFYTRNFPISLPLTPGPKTLRLPLWQFIKNKGIIGAGYFVGDNYVKRSLPHRQFSSHWGLKTGIWIFWYDYYTRQGFCCTWSKNTRTNGGNGLIQISWNSFSARVSGWIMTNSISGFTNFPRAQV